MFNGDSQQRLNSSVLRMTNHLLLFRGYHSASRLLGAFACLVAFSFVVSSPSTDAQDFSIPFNPFFTQYCNDCHADGSDEGGLQLDELSTDLGDAATFAKWERIFDRVQTGEMPPEDSNQPSDQHRQTFSRQLAEPLVKAHAARKGTVLRRLNRREYQNTMNDLFGTNLDLESLLPKDGQSHEFDNVGEALSISLVQLQRYMEAADLVLDAAIARSTERPKAIVKKANYAETGEGQKHIGKAWKQADDGAVVFFRPLGYPSGMLRTANVTKTGHYKIRVTGYAYQTDRPVTFSVGGTSFQRGSSKPTFGYFSFPPGKPSTIELEASIKERYMIEITPWGISDKDNEIRKNGVNDYKGPGLAINHVELEGPIVDEFPSRGHRLVFDGLQRKEIEPSNPSTKKKSWYVPKFELLSETPQADAIRVLTRVATKAFRRPASDGEVEDYVDLLNSQMNDGASFEQALRTAVTAIFCSPEFLYLAEPEGWLDDDAIASRLSYFLTRTAPDDALLDAASKNQLSKDPQVLLAHTRRLLDDPRCGRFVTDFGDAWLNLRDIEFTSPDKNLFPEFDRFLQYSMQAETREFLAHLLRENARVRNLVKSDFAMLNNRLAKLYQIDGVDGPEIRRVSLPADSVRGGLLSQASILKVSANGTNTSPVVRGVWVMERIVGKTPPPPPPGIPGVEPDIRGASTLRELLDKHRDSDSCRTCHTMIDPPGFALESFNPIGGWRDHFRSLGEGERVNLMVNGRNVRYKIGPQVDSSGQLEDGTKFDGFREFRDLLARDQDTLAKTVATKLLTFATGREMGFSDRGTINEIVKQSKQKGHRIRDIIELVVLSEAFRRK